MSNFTKNLNKSNRQLLDNRYHSQMFINFNIFSQSAKSIQTHRRYTQTTEDIKPKKQN